MQHTARIAVAADTIGGQAVGIDARHLGCDVGADAHGAATELVGDAKGKQVNVCTQADQQGFGEFDQRRDHQLVSPALVQIQ